MRIIRRGNPLQYMAAVRARDRRAIPPPRADGVGYSQTDPNAFPQGAVYNEQLIFNAPTPVNLAQAGLGASAALNSSIAADSAPTSGPAEHLNDDFALTPFTVGTEPETVLGANAKRSCLIIQNLDGADTLYFNLGAVASPIAGIALPAGAGVLFDYRVPNDWVSVVFASGTARGVVVEAGEGAGTRRVHGVHLMGFG